MNAFTEVLDYAERRMRACLQELPDGERRAEDVLEAREGDLPIKLRATVKGDELELDFMDTHREYPGILPFIDSQLEGDEERSLHLCPLPQQVVVDPG